MQQHLHWLAIELVLVQQHWRWLRLGEIRLELWFVLRGSGLWLGRSRVGVVRVGVLTSVRKGMGIIGGKKLA
jgi:hypothetical protein